MDHIPIPNFRQDGISKWGLIFHTEANLIYDEVLDPVMRKMEVARLIAPKIAYQWFSNLLSSAWWSNFWLHDALATMFGEEAVAKSFNNSEILDLFIIQNQYESLHLDSHFNMNPVEITNLSDINSIFSFPRYMKVIIVLRMFQNAITDKVFRNNIQIYVSRQSFSSNFMSYNFWFIKEGLDEVYYCNLPSHVFLTWIQCKHYPVVIWEQYRRSEVVKIISQSYNKTSYGVWVTPITLKEISLFYADLKTCLKPNVTSIRYPTTFPLNELWMVNFQQAGKLMEKPLKTLGYEEHLVENDFVKCLRQEIVKWACIFQFDECEQSALRKLQQHLGNPEKNPLLPWWKHWTYCNGLAIAHSFTWSHLKDAWFKGRNHTLLPFLTCFKYGSDTASTLLLELFKQNEYQDITNIRSYVNIFHSIIMKHSNTYYILEKILTFFEIIKPQQINILTGLVDIINHVYSYKNLMKSFNNSEILDLFIIQNQYESLHLDSHFNMNPVENISLSDIDSILSFPRYMKALIVLRMFQSAITDEVFRNNVHVYVSRQTFSSIISYNFWSMKEELDEAYNCNLPSNEFLTWIKYKHYPVVIWEQYVHSRVTKRISQRYNTTSYGKWLIPIDLTEISSLNENMWKICLKPNIDSSEFPIITSLNEVWMVNFQQAGYYRAKYDSVTWGIIAKHLNDTAGHYEDISVINRAKIIDDAFHLMMNRQLNVSEFWNLTQFLSQETNFLVWYPMIKVFEYTSITIPLSKVEIRFIDIMVKFRTLLEKPLKTLGYEEHLIENDFTKCLRQEIVKWACIFQYDECEQSALRKLQQHLENPEINP
ncbi:PREDICTED: uncharacterized protein LOC108764218 [Trachymyrmex cornetzi]|uniref:uncharacterized protein LOC108764218 n=1 Tax=Trachymyrmex cornetzi TaxID=471704 RepID=UPI00084F3CFD|nr:PREDICTED: uncharacterized protein LOC108764218 [Trachymyrmex cornetzi]